jgi:hypothetical protein
MPICPQCGLRHDLSQSLCLGCLKDDHRRSGDDSPRNETSTMANLGEGICEFAVNDEQGEAEIGDSENGERGAAIARFQSGAEAGYFADELTRETGIEADVLVREKFDAVHAVWTVDYLLQVSPLHVQEATRALQSLVEATGDDAGEESTGRSVTDLPSGVWVPLILTLAAGSIACF